MAEQVTLNLRPWVRIPPGPPEKETKMINQVIGQGGVKLTPQELEEVPILIPYQLPNTDMYPTKVRFKTMGMDGQWILVNIIEVDGKDELDKGVNIFVNRIILT